MPLDLFNFTACEVSKLFADYTADAPQFVSRFRELAQLPSTTTATTTAPASGKSGMPKIDETNGIDVTDTETENVAEVVETPVNKSSRTSKAKRKLDISPTVENPIVSPPKPKRNRQDNSSTAESEYTTTSDVFLAKIKKYEVAGKSYYLINM